jgi:hypothetical protein
VRTPNPALALAWLALAAGCTVAPEEPDDTETACPRMAISSSVRVTFARCDLAADAGPAEVVACLDGVACGPMSIQGVGDGCDLTRGEGAPRAKCERRDRDLGVWFALEGPYDELDAPHDLHVALTIRGEARARTVPLTLIPRRAFGWDCGVTHYEGDLVLETSTFEVVP